MRAAGLEPALDLGGETGTDRGVRILAIARQGDVIGDGVFAGSAVGIVWDLKLGAVARGAHQLRLDAAILRVGRVAGEGDIGALDGVTRELDRHPLVRRIRLGRDHHARRILVEPVDNARPLDTANARQGAGAMMQQAVHEGARPVARRRMHGEADRFDQHHEIIILIQDVEIHLFRHRIGGDGRRHGEGVDRTGDDLG